MKTTMLGLMLLASSLALSGCASRTKPTPADTDPNKPFFRITTTSQPKEAKIEVLKTLAGTRWQVIELDGLPVPEPMEGWAPQGLEFDAAGKMVAGNAGVNRFGGRYTSRGTDLSFGPLAMTRRIGPAAQMERERQLTEAMSEVTAWRQDGVNVVLLDAGSRRVMLLAPVKRVQ
jgi:heat shock protein HslJ